MPRGPMGGRRAVEEPHDFGKVMGKLVNYCRNYLPVIIIALNLFINLLFGGCSALRYGVLSSTLGSSGSGSTSQSQSANSANSGTSVSYTIVGDASTSYTAGNSDASTVSYSAA